MRIALIESELIKLATGGGGVVACILVVILFLKQQDKVNDLLKQIADKFSADIISYQKAFQDQLITLTAQSYSNQKLYQDQMKVMIDDHIELTKETITALKSNEATVRAIETTVKELQAMLAQDRKANSRSN